jgi:hypothetical protein
MLASLPEVMDEKYVLTLKFYRGEDGWIMWVCGLLSEDDNYKGAMRSGSSRKEAVANLMIEHPELWKATE